MKNEKCKNEINDDGGVWGLNFAGGGCSRFSADVTAFSTISPAFGCFLCANRS